MVKKNKKWDWMEKQEKAFKELKEKFTKELVLAALDLDKKNENESRCIGLCYRRGVINGVRKWIMKTGGIPFQVFE